MEACIANIGASQRRRRLFTGALAFAGAALFGLALTEASTIVRTAVFFPLFAAGIGFFQYREKT